MINTTKFTKSELIGLKADINKLLNHRFSWTISKNRRKNLIVNLLEIDKNL